MQVPVELKIKYLSRRKEDVEKLKASLELNDFSQALRIGHQVKGNAVTFDVPQMAFLGVEMERAAMEKNKEKIHFIIQKMETVIRAAESRY
jgi:HPt (histidine-containing phosphotransfer) domain-containing protein